MIVPQWLQDGEWEVVSQYEAEDLLPSGPPCVRWLGPHDSVLESALKRLATHYNYVSSGQLFLATSTFRYRVVLRKLVILFSV